MSASLPRDIDAAAQPAPGDGPKRASAKEIIVAIPTLNEAEHIDACLRSLMAGDPRLADIKFVVADGGSNDGTQAIVQELAKDLENVRLLHNPKRVQAAAINQVASEAVDADHTILVRCDAHALYPPGYVTQIADSLINRDAASVVVCMDAVGTTCFQKANAWIVDTPLGSGGSAHRGGSKSMYTDHGHHAGFRLEAFRALGGYDETFTHNEDAEFDQRLIASGRKIWLDATIRHDYVPRGTVRALAKQYFNYGKGRARNILKHRTRPKFRQLAPVCVILALAGSAILSVLTPAFLALPALYALLLIAASVYVAISKRSACGLFSGLAAGTMHIGWGAGFLRQLTQSAWR
ncbi:MAG: glycosyltransferase family 2 protein [Pseudomonadota bacterium]